MHPLASEVLAGFIGGSAKTLALYPLDTLTTLRELRIRPSRALSQYYRGCGLTLLGLAPYAIIFHTAFYVCDAALTDVMPAAARQMCAGLFGSVASAFVGVPFECLKHRLQVSAPMYATPQMALANTIRLEGVRGLFSGFGSTLARNAPYNALHFGIFAAVSRTAGSIAHGRAADALAGAVAGALTALLTTPLDLVNTRLQTQAVRAVQHGGPQYAGVCDALVRIAAEEGGPSALMQGSLVRVAQYAPASIIFFMCYQAVKCRLQEPRGI
uniref:Mitochondrial carrier protein n=1 Tax=Coccolithus braarudii TaxID=221442 RepID=A0A6T7K4K6_9EUKA|mmetsp:Transcript_5242/g.11494  ORF Transcript_5242/g.11494 Transcript_5242/m.11494 type:complete len:270 (+) Transcript_5242:65-874(+)